MNCKPETGILAGYYPPIGIFVVLDRDTSAQE
jgi:hypothetical protein